MIMSTEKPSTEVKALLKIPYYKRRVSYIRGSEMVWGVYVCINGKGHV